MRKYSKRTKSTRSKTHEEFKAYIDSLRDQGYEISASAKKMYEDERRYSKTYNRYKLLRKTGDIKISAWDSIKRSSLIMSPTQLKTFLKAQTKMLSEIPEGSRFKKATKDQVLRGEVPGMYTAMVYSWLNNAKANSLGGAYV